MTEGFIQITEPIFCEKDEHIKLAENCNKIICVIKGQFMVSDRSLTLNPGEVVGLNSILSNESEVFDLIALEDSAIIEINNKDIEEIMNSKPEAFKEILSDTVNLLSEIKDML